MEIFIPIHSTIIRCRREWKGLSEELGRVGSLKYPFKFEKCKAIKKMKSCNEHEQQVARHASEYR
jgi:hypothetical protein